MNLPNPRLVLAAAMLAAAPFVAGVAHAADGPPAPPPAPPPAAAPAPTFAMDPADPRYARPCGCEPVPDACACPAPCIRDPLVRIPCFDDTVDAFQKSKAESMIKIGAGAYHWWNVQSDGGDVTYGYPNGGEGTYFYYFTGDVDLSKCASPCGPKFGGHVELRARDETVFRSFFDEKVWFYELYAWVDTPAAGKFKVGKMWKRFGLDWDGSFWGNVQYYDGMKLDPDWGFSWEKTFNPSPRLSIPVFAQLFLEEDGVNGSIAGADAESTGFLEEQTTGVLRVVPTWKFNTNTSLAVGVSGLVGSIEAQSGSPVASDTLAQVAVDATFQWCGLKVYGEYAYSDGAQNPSHYVTGGPSDTYKDYLVGVEYKLGPFTPRVTYSHGDYENPGGSQDLWLVGLTVQLTNWLTAYLEYVKWDVDSPVNPDVQYEDGFQIVLNWHF